MAILKGNESFDVILMDSLLNCSAGDHTQSEFLEHGGWNLQDITQSGVSFKLLGSRGDQTKRVGLAQSCCVLEDIFDSLCREYNTKLIKS